MLKEMVLLANKVSKPEVRNMLQQCLIANSGLLPVAIHFSEKSQTSIKTLIYTGFNLY